MSARIQKDNVKKIGIHWKTGHSRHLPKVIRHGKHDDRASTRVGCGPHTNNKSHTHTQNTQTEGSTHCDHYKNWWWGLTVNYENYSVRSGPSQVKLMSSYCSQSRLAKETTIATLFFRWHDTSFRPSSRPRGLFQITVVGASNMAKCMSIVSHWTGYENNPYWLIEELMLFWGRFLSWTHSGIRDHDIFEHMYIIHISGIFVEILNQFYRLDSGEKRTFFSLQHV